MRDLPKTTRVIEEGMARGLHSGAQVYISIHGKAVANTAMGEARPGLAMASDSIMPWFSAGKPLTAVAAALLVHRGAVGWDTPVCSVIPEFARGRKEGILLRHLLTHTAGFRLAELRCPEAGWERTLQCACETPLEPGWEPGVKAGYQRQASWLVLAEFIQRVAQQPFASFVRENVLDPFGMVDCAVGMSPAELAERRERMGVMQTSVEGVLRPHPAWSAPEVFLEPRPGANACGPMAGLGAFYERLLAVLSGERGALPVDVVREMTRRQRLGLYDHTFRCVLDWGYGFIINSGRYGVEPPPYGFGDDASEESFGHGGSQSSSAFADPAAGLVVAWVCNGMPGDAEHSLRARRLNSAIYEDLGLGAAS